MNRCTFWMIVLIAAVLFESWTAPTAWSQPRGDVVVLPGDSSEFQANISNIRLPSLIVDDLKVGRLVWTNGYSIPGELHSATGQDVQWSTPLFKGVIGVDFNFIRHLRFPNSAGSEATKQPLQFSMHGGDVIFGQLAAIDVHHLEIESVRSGRIRLQRSHVNRIQRLNNPSLLFLGPVGLTGWKSIRKLRSADEWTSTDRKFLETEKRNAELYRPIEVSALSEFEVTLETNVTFGFMMTFDNEVGLDQPKATLSVETWGDELVLVSGDDYEPLMWLSETVKTLSLRLMLDRAKKSLTVFSETGKLLGSLNGELPERANAGFYIRNKARHLRLKSLRVQKSSGQPPTSIKDLSRRVRLVDGTSLYGEVTGFDAETGDVSIKQDEGEATVALKRIDSLTLSVDPPKPTTPEQATGQSPSVELTFKDSARLSGQLVGVNNGVLELQTSYAESPIATKLVGASQLSNPKPRLAQGNQEQLDLLGTSAGTLAGKLHLPEAPSESLQWKFPGGDAPVWFSSDAEAVVERQLVNPTFPVDRTVIHDQLFLENGDAFPCVIESIDEQHVHFNSPWTETRQVDVAHVKAVELSVTGQTILSGFGSPGWGVSSTKRSAAEATDDRLEFFEPARLGHESIMHGDEVSFELLWTENATPLVRLDMLAGSTEDGTERSEHILIRCRNEAVLVSQAAGLAALFSAEKNKLVPCPDRRASIKIKHRRSGLRVTINNKPVYSASFNVERAELGKGLHFTVTGLPKRDADQKKESLVTVSDFEIWKTRSGAAHRSIDAQIKTQTLTIPRARRKNPSPNVLIATDGDLLRGRLVAADKDTITFESRLESFRFDRKRMAAIVWLHPQVETSETESPDAGDKQEAAESPDESTGEASEDKRPVLRAVYSHGVNATVLVDKVHRDVIYGESPILGKCVLPLADASRLHLGGFGEVTDSFTYRNWTSVPADEPKFAVVFGAGAIESAAMKMIGQPAPDFDLKLLNGKDFSLTDHTGKVVVLDFWATWCVPCVRAMPAYLAATSDIDPDKFLFVAVNQDEPAPLVKEFLKRRSWTVSVAMDPGAKVGEEFNVEGLPHTVVIGPDGKIVALHEGYRRGVESELRKSVDQALMSLKP